MKPVRLPAAATLALPRWAVFALGLLYILPGLIGRDPWKRRRRQLRHHVDHGAWRPGRLAAAQYRRPGRAGRRPAGVLAGRRLHQAVRLAAGRRAWPPASPPSAFSSLGALSVWYAAFHLGRRSDAQPLRLAFGGQPEPNDYGRTLADTALLIYLGCLGLLLHSHETLAVTLQGSLLAFFVYRATRYVETASGGNAVLVGVALGGLVLTRGLAAARRAAAGPVPVHPLPEHLRRRDPARPGHRRLVALLLTLVWVLPASLLQPYGLNPVAGWLEWNMSQVGVPTWHSVKFLARVGMWFFWPAWPFAAVGHLRLAPPAPFAAHRRAPELRRRPDAADPVRSRRRKTATC